MGGFIIEYESNDQRFRKQLHPKKMFELLDRKLLPWPEIEDAEIDDRSKADGFVKLLAVAQILWFVTQTIGRAAQGMAMTTLELFTLGIVLCAVMIYGVLWEMPFDIQQPIVIHVQESGNIIDCNSDFERVSMMGNSFVGLIDDRWCGIICTIVSLGFSALHVVAWNFHFSTNTELWLWRVSSIVCTVTPLGIAVLVWELLDLYEWLEDVLFLVLPALYIIGRLYMFVEMFVSLRAVPASVYETPQWSQYFPSFS